jgi:hypothetical protein
MGSTKAIRRADRAHRPLDRERIIAAALVDVASELRLTDAAELILTIRNDHEANIADLVNSTTELFFKSGTLRYALSASFKAPWDATPVVAIDMEFRHAMVSAFFRLTIGQSRAGLRSSTFCSTSKGWTTGRRPTGCAGPSPARACR